MWMSTSSINLSFHIMTFKGIFSKYHEVIKNSHCPNINRNSIVWIAKDLWGHIFLSTTMGFSSWATDWSCKTKISNFISNVKWVSVFIYFFQKDILRFNITVNKIFFMNTLKTFENFNHNFCCLFKSKSFSWKLSLICKEITHFTILHNNHDKIRISKLLLIFNNVGMAKLLHNTDLLIDIFFKERFFSNLSFSNELDSKQFILFISSKNNLSKSSFSKRLDYFISLLV